MGRGLALAAGLFVLALGAGPAAAANLPQLLTACTGPASDRTLCAHEIGNIAAELDAGVTSGALSSVQADKTLADLINLVAATAQAGKVGLAGDAIATLASHLDDPRPRDAALVMARAIAAGRAVGTVVASVASLD